MRANRTHQPLTYDVRLPDEAQADALRLLDESRAVVNQALTILWPHLDEFGSERIGPAFLIPRMRLPGNTWGSTSEAHPYMVTVNGGESVKWSDDFYASKQNERG